MCILEAVLACCQAVLEGSDAAVLVSHSRTQVLQLTRHLGSCLPEGSMDDALGKLHLPRRIHGQHSYYLQMSDMMSTPQCSRSMHPRRRCVCSLFLQLSRRSQLAKPVQRVPFPTSFGTEKAYLLSQLWGADRSIRLSACDSRHSISH